MSFALIKWLLLGVCIFLLIFFPLISLYWIARTKKMRDQDQQRGGYADLKASLLFLQTAFPTILFLLGALGYGTFEVITNRVTATVTARVFKNIQRDKIAAWTKQIEVYKEKSQTNAELIEAMYANSQDSIRSIANAAFVQMLPRGTIIPYSGRRADIDFNVWAICDGKNGTPDLRSRFILGCSFPYLGRTGGSKFHTHTASTVPRGRVEKSNVLRFSHKDGLQKSFKIAVHQHAFKGIQSKVTVSKTATLPPYYRLVFLMKIV